MEAIFDACYLIFDLIAGILFFVYSKGNPLFILYGVLTLTLCGGDAFHLVPRIKRAVYGTNDKIKRQLGIGLQVSSITMTVFYIILLFIWKLTFPTLQAPLWVEAMIGFQLLFVSSYVSYRKIIGLPKKEIGSFL